VKLIRAALQSAPIPQFCPKQILPRSAQSALPPRFYHTSINTPQIFYNIFTVAAHRAATISTPTYTHSQFFTKFFSISARQSNKIFVFLPPKEALLQQRTVQNSLWSGCFGLLILFSKLAAHRISTISLQHTPTLQFFKIFLSKKITVE
jgi:hypothetical protein